MGRTVTFDFKITFEKHLHSVSRAASQRLGINWGSPGEYSMIDRFLEMLSGFCPAHFGVLFWRRCSTAATHIKLLDHVVSGAGFLTGGVFVCDIAHCISVAVPIRIGSVYTRNGSIYYKLHSDKKQTVHSEWKIGPWFNKIWKEWRKSKSNFIEKDYWATRNFVKTVISIAFYSDRFFLFVIYRWPNLLFIIMNDPLVNIDIDVNLFNNIYPDLNGNQSSEYQLIPT